MAKIDLTETGYSNSLFDNWKNVILNRDIYIDIFNRDGDIYFYTPNHKEKIKIDQKKLFEFIKKFEKKEEKVNENYS